MNLQTVRAQAYQLLRLIHWYVVPSDKNPDMIPADTQALLKLAEKHLLSALASAALKKAGAATEYSKVLLAKARQKAVLVQMEYETIIHELEQREIQYMPLKGALLTQLYPSFALREMSDIDILINGDADTFAVIKSVMGSKQYRIKSYAKTNHDIYIKPPFFVFEIHRTLFNRFSYPQIQRYFDNRSYLTAEKDSCRLTMSADEQYIYLVAHAYIHHSTAGTGLRTLLDFYLYLKHFEKELHFDDITSELRTLSMDGFEKELRNLSQKFLSPESLTEAESEALDYYIFSGVHGTGEILAKNRVLRYKQGEGRRTDTGYIAHRLIPPEQVIQSHPFIAEHPSLIPLLGAKRLAATVVKKPRTILNELKALKKFSEK